MNNKVSRYPKKWDSNFYDSAITLVLAPPDCGWIRLLLTGSGWTKTADVSFSGVYDPIPAFVDWFCAIAQDNLPACIDINEEGVFCSFVARPVKNRPDWMELHIYRSSARDEGAKDAKTLHLSRCEKRQFVKEFHRRFTQWLQKDYIPEQWHHYGRHDDEDGEYCNDPRALNLEPLKQFIS